ncbi:MAG TPA: peptidylprolyl isomerase [Gammaproteobacteria bacterium]|nr:peptidylprolyl isomerase [Gammaproteobacteria bacterium]MEC8010947.1 peptidylprolyl isomerase [Pseudomonadota bacterium]HBF09697.1 peptidylprolyl isomerase [Gammaproteobacteria bacterium]HCK93190.1 peptidylprolyl isomerase [Gammaproteobacteria bacterium]|tara:strand:- start:5522 stop:6028 length:507 start_codon:yes stop_codon:yes gene_type:complete
MTNAAAELVENNQVVAMHYTLKDKEGNVLDTSEGQDPLTYLHGASNIIPGLEKALAGKAVGDQVNVKVDPKEAYGESNPELVQQVPAQMFEGVEDLAAGMVFQVQANESQPPQRIVIQSVDGDVVTVDGNHPLAGVELHFDVNIVSVRPATETEVEHGHVHGDGHDHH